MTGFEFKVWLAAMKQRGVAATDAECGAKIGKSPDTVVRMKKEGASYAIALACSAALLGLEPWNVPKEVSAGDFTSQPNR